MLTIRASALGSCTKALIAGLMGYAPLPVSDQMQATYDRGTVHETANGDALVEQGWGIVHKWEGFETDEDQIFVRLQVADVIEITGHLDGVILHEEHTINPPRVWESKSPASWAKFEQAARTNVWTEPLIHRYGWQISCYMHALGMEAMVTCLDGEEVKSFVIEVPPFSLEQIEARCMDIAEAVATQNLPVACSQADYPCPVAYLHETPEVDEDEELDAKVALYAFHAEQVKYHKRLADDAKDLIEAHLGDREQVNTASSKVSRYTQKNPDKVDKDAMRRDGVYELYVTPGGDSTRIKITSRGDE